MEWAVWAASSDSEDATTEKDDEGAPSSTGQQGSLFEEAAASSASNAQGSIDLAFVNKAVSTRNGLDSMGMVKSEAGAKPLHKGIKNLIHFGKKDGSKVPFPHGLDSTMRVNILEEDGISDSDSEEGQELVTAEDLGETAEELEFHSSTSELWVVREENPRKSEILKKRRNFTEDGQGQASKLVKRSKQPQKSQIQHASTESGKGTTDLPRWQWSESFQSRHLEENYAAEEPVNCTQSTESPSRSSQLVGHQEVYTENGKFRCPECKVTCRTSFRLTRHQMSAHKLATPFKCSECNKHFASADAMRSHRLNRHAGKSNDILCSEIQCTVCNEMFSHENLLRLHLLKPHYIYDTKIFAVDETYFS